MRAVSRAGELVGKDGTGKACSPTGSVLRALPAVYTDRSEYATHTIGGLQKALKTEGNCLFGKVSQAAENPAEH